MVEDRSVQLERRKDRRIPIRARVRIAPREGSGSQSADLIDVSAGGLRARTDHPAAFAAGHEVDVEIRLGGRRKTGTRAEVCLRGAAVIVRVESAEGGPGDTALCFTGPLDMREPFDKLLIF